MFASTSLTFFYWLWCNTVFAGFIYTYIIMEISCELFTLQSSEFCIILQWKCRKSYFRDSRFQKNLENPPTFKRLAPPLGWSYRVGEIVKGSGCQVQIRSCTLISIRLGVRVGIMQIRVRFTFPNTFLRELIVLIISDVINNLLTYI